MFTCISLRENTTVGTGNSLEISLSYLCLALVTFSACQLAKEVIIVVHLISSSPFHYHSSYLNN